MIVAISIILLGAFAVLIVGGCYSLGDDEYDELPETRNEEDIRFW
jgi:hypothetical protein